MVLHEHIALRDQERLCRQSTYEAQHSYTDKHVYMQDTEGVVLLLQPTFFFLQRLYDMVWCIAIGIPKSS